MGFDGIVVSDYMAINQLSNYHQMAKDQAQAALLSLEAGMDVELPNTVCYGQPSSTPSKRARCPSP